MKLKNILLLGSGILAQESLPTGSLSPEVLAALQSLTPAQLAAISAGTSAVKAPSVPEVSAAQLDPVVDPSVHVIPGETPPQAAASPVQPAAPVVASVPLAPAPPSAPASPSAPVSETSAMPSEGAAPVVPLVPAAPAVPVVQVTPLPTTQTTNATTTLNPLAPVESLDTDPLTISNERLEDLPEAPLAPPAPAAPSSPIQLPIQSTEPLVSEAAAPVQPKVEPETKSVQDIIASLSPEMLAQLTGTLQQKDEAAYEAEIPEVVQTDPEVEIPVESVMPETEQSTTPVAVGSEPIASIAQDIIQGQLAAAQPGLEQIDANQFGSRADTPVVLADETQPIQPEPEVPMMTGTNPEIYAGSPVPAEPEVPAAPVTETATDITEPEVASPVVTSDLPVDDEEAVLDDYGDDYDDDDEDLGDDEWEDDWYNDNEDDDDYDGDYDDDYDGDYDGDDDYYNEKVDGALDNILMDEEADSYNYRSRPISIDEEQIEKHEEIFDEAEEAERSEYNFAFFMIVFIFIFTGGYYAYSKIKEKFYPQSEQQYQLLEKADPDVKQSVSSEKKEEENWDNDW